MDLPFAWWAETVVLVEIQAQVRQKTSAYISYAAVLFVVKEWSKRMWTYVVWIINPKENTALFIVWKNHKRVGIGGYKKVRNGIAEMKHMRFLPRVRGQGLGSKLALFLEDDMRKNGYISVMLDTFNAQFFYMKLGYRMTHSAPRENWTIDFFQKDL